LPQKERLIGMGDKAPVKKEKGKQYSLTEQPEDKPDNIDSVVSKAFDSDPQVRLKVAQDLSKIDDPRAIFALIELSSDKDEAVKEAAQRSLGTFKDEQEEITSIGKLLSERKEAAKVPAAAPAPSVPMPPHARPSMMPALERLFAHYEPKRRESVKRKLLPSLQKLFGFKPEELDPLQDIDKISQSHVAEQTQQDEESGEVERKEQPEKPQNASNFPFGKHEEPRERRVPQPPEQQESEKEDLVPIDEESHEVVGGTHESGDAEKEPWDGDEYAICHTRIFELAHNLATTPGYGKAELKREQNRVITAFKKEVEIAFKIAAIKASEDGMASLSNLKPGMKNLSFAEMQVMSITESSYGNKKKPHLRIALSDGKREVALFVPRDRGQGITTSDKIAPKHVAVDFLIDRSEVILVASAKSSIVVVK
jgi:hypothetical protein